MSGLTESDTARATSPWASVELAAPLEPRPEIRFVLFDFDGTLSLIRQGWSEVMVPMFLEALPRTPGETDNDVRQLVIDDIMRLNGKQTIYQMIQLAERITERGGTPQEPLAYKHEYLRRLGEHIGSRTHRLRSREIQPDELLVHLARPLLENLRERGLELYLASGTDEYAVKDEAEQLDLTRYFGNHIYGALDDYKRFSKKIIIDRILEEEGISGNQLLAFGDGYVEIENTKQVGGFAVAVASDEAHNGSGRVDEWKRKRLLGVGADAVIPDYRDAIAFVDRLLGK
jgi:phosphoglycolate phosphatase-like HAD superfamily hydrolase